MQGITRRREFSALLAAGLLLTVDCSKAAASTQRVSIALAARHSLYHLPLIVADQIGYFKAEGLHIDWIDADSGSHAVSLAANGQADVVSGAFEHTLDLQAQGLNFRAFVLQGRAPQISLGLVSRRLATMKSPADLKSIRMGISSVGSATHWMAQHWMRQVGLFSDNVQLIELGGNVSESVEAVRAGSVDGLCHVDPVMHYLEQKAELRVLAETRTLTSSQRMFGGPMPSACLFAREDFLKTRADATRGLTSGVLRALNWLKTAGPTDILKVVPSPHWMGDRALYLGAFEKVRDSYSPDGLFGKEALQTAGRARASRITDDRSNWKTLGQSYTNEFVQALKRKPAL